MIKYGIWFKNYKWGERIAEAILKNSSKDMLIRYTKSVRKIHFEFTDIVVDIIPAIESSRGHKFDIMYLQDGIDDDTLRMIILPCLMRQMTSDVPPIRILQDEEVDNFGFISAEDTYPKLFKKD